MRVTDSAASAGEELNEANGKGKGKKQELSLRGLGLTVLGTGIARARVRTTVRGREETPRNHTHHWSGEVWVLVLHCVPAPSLPVGSCAYGW